MNVDASALPRNSGSRHLLPLLVGALADNADVLMAWACWTVPLILAEPFIPWRRVRA